MNRNTLSKYFKVLILHLCFILETPSLTVHSCCCMMIFVPYIIGRQGQHLVAYLTSAPRGGIRSLATLDMCTGGVEILKQEVGVS